MKIEEFKNIIKWNPVLKGKGIKIGVMELGCGNDTDKLYTDVINAKSSSDRANRHTNLVGWVLREMLPEAEIYLLDSTITESYQWCEDNGVHIINMSISDTSADFKKFKGFRLTSAGNSSDDGETMSDRNAPYWLQVGAVDVKDEKFSLMNYSSWGRDKVDMATLSGIETPYGTFHGTSCSSPLATALLAQYYETFHMFYDSYPTITQTYDFIDKHSSNIFIFDKQSDKKIGYGFLILPEKFHFKKIELRFPKGENKSYLKVLIFEDDNVTTKDILVPAEIIDGRTRMGVRDLSNLLGQFIQWNNEDRKVEIFVQQGDH